MGITLYAWNFYTYRFTLFPLPLLTSFVYLRHDKQLTEAVAAASRHPGFQGLTSDALVPEQQFGVSLQ